MGEQDDYRDKVAAMSDRTNSGNGGGDSGGGGEDEAGVATEGDSSGVHEDQDPINKPAGS